MGNNKEQAFCSFERGFEKGYEQAMIECSGGLEDTYLGAYKDGYYGKPPVVEDDELRAILSGQPATPKTYMENAGIETLTDDFCVSGKILCMVEDAKKNLFEVRKKIYKSNIDAEEQRMLALKILKVVDLLDEVQHQYTSDEMYRYLGYME